MKGSEWLEWLYILIARFLRLKVQKKRLELLAQLDWLKKTCCLKGCYGLTA
jgi:hypothetical protein